MKTLFIPAKKISKIDKSKVLSLTKKLPINIAIAYSIQYKEQAKEIKSLLSKSHKVNFFTQVLGCSKPNFPKNTKAILLIGNSRFHATALALETDIPIYILENNSLTEITQEDTENFKRKQKSSYVKFLNANKVGILISTKPGQQRLKQAINIKKKLKKQSYLFICNNINTSEFENFGLDSYINTACPRIDMDSNMVINIDRLR